MTLANFTANPTTGLTPLTTYFTNLTVGGTNFLWNFGDGGSSTATNPAHIYATAGNFDVSLRAIGPNGTIDNFYSSFEVDGNAGGQLLVDGGTFTQVGKFLLSLMAKDIINSKASRNRR